MTRTGTIGRRTVALAVLVVAALAGMPGVAFAGVTIDIKAPAPGATYEVGQVVTIDYTCATTDPAYPVTQCDLSSDTGTLVPGTQLDTSTPGTFEVSATLFNGEPPFGGEVFRYYYTVVAPLPPPASCEGRVATIVGTEGADVLRGTSGDDVIVGLGGNDVIDGGSGNDIICGGAGDDRIQGGSGNDIVRGDSGNDVLDGGSGNDRLFGDAGIDRLRGGSDNDTLDGGPGAPDRCDGEGDEDTATAACEQTISIP